MSNTALCQSSQDCSKLLKSVWTKYHKLSQDVPADKVYHMDYTVNATLRNVTNLSQDQRIKMWMTHDRAMIKSDHVEVYTTESYTASVLPQVKRINITSLTKGESQSMRSQYALNRMDSLFFYYNMASCTDSEGDLLSIRLTPNSGGVEAFNVAEARFIVDPNALKMKSLHLVMGPQGSITETTMTFHRIEEDYQGTIRPIDFIRENTTVDGDFKKPYATYHITDQRTR